MIEIQGTHGSVLGLVERLTSLAETRVADDVALASALAEICDFTGWPLGHIVLARRGEAVGTAVWHGADGDGLEAFRSAGDSLRLRVGEGLTGRVLDSASPVWIGDLRDDSSFLRRDEAIAAGIRAALMHPLIAAGEVVGVLELFDYDLREPDQELLALLRLVVGELGRMIERRRATELLRQSEERYRMLFERASDAILVGDATGRLTQANPAACLLLGYAEAELIGMSGRAFCAPEWLDIADHELGRKLEGVDESSIYELTLVDRAGKRIPVEVRSTVLRDGDEVTGIHAVLRDIRERRRAELELRESEERFRGAFDASAVGMALCSTEGRFLKVNDSLCLLLGYSKDELLSMRWQDATLPEDLEENLAKVRGMIAGEYSSFQLEKRFLQRDGRTVRVQISVSLVRDEDGAPAYAVAQILPLEPVAVRDTGAACPLSARERQVLTLVSRGNSSAQVAERLGIGGETVQTHLRRATRKLGAKSRPHAIATAVRNGWVDLDGPDEPDRGPTASVPVD